MKKSILTFIAVLMIFSLSACGNSGQKHPFRNFSWGMTKDEVAQLEEDLGSSLNLGSTSYDILYNIYDFDELQEAFTSYSFRDDKLYEFTIAGVTNEDVFFEMIKDIEKVYGEGEHNSLNLANTYSKTVEWDTEKETVSCRLIGSNNDDKNSLHYVFFTFTDVSEDK